MRSGPELAPAGRESGHLLPYDPRPGLNPASTPIAGIVAGAGAARVTTRPPSTRNSSPVAACERVAGGREEGPARLLRRVRSCASPLWARQPPTRACLALGASLSHLPRVGQHRSPRGVHVPDPKRKSYPCTPPPRYPRGPADSSFSTRGLCVPRRGRFGPCSRTSAERGDPDRRRSRCGPRVDSRRRKPRVRSDSARVAA